MKTHAANVDETDDDHKGEREDPSYISTKQKQLLASNLGISAIKEESQDNDDEDDAASNIANVHSPSSANTKLGAVKKFKDYKIDKK